MMNFIRCGAIGSLSDAELARPVITTAIVLPHLICTVLAVIFNGLGLSLGKFALTDRIIYLVAIVPFILYFFFTV